MFDIISLYWWYWWYLHVCYDFHDTCMNYVPRMHDCLCRSAFLDQVTAFQTHKTTWLWWTGHSCNWHPKPPGPRRCWMVQFRPEWLQAVRRQQTFLKDLGEFQLQMIARGSRFDVPQGQLPRGGGAGVDFFFSSWGATRNLGVNKKGGALLFYLFGCHLYWNTKETKCAKKLPQLPELD